MLVKVARKALMFVEIERRFHESLPAVDHCSLRLERRLEERLTVERDVAGPSRRRESVGGMVTVQVAVAGSKMTVMPSP